MTFRPIAIESRNHIYNDRAIKQKLGLSAHERIAAISRGARAAARLGMSSDLKGYKTQKNGEQHDAIPRPN